jgi:membrane protein implicated in regulation of membrane protease activity
VIWQDVVMMIGNILFALALIPAIRDSKKPPVATSIPTGMLLCMFAIALASLQLWLSAISSLVSCVLWFALAYQRHNQDRLERRSDV